MSMVQIVNQKYLVRRKINNQHFIQDTYRLLSFKLNQMSGVLYYQALNVIGNLNKPV